MTRTITAIACAIIFFSCRTITGSGDIKITERHINDFDGVKSSGSIEVEVNNGSYGVKVEADDNVMKYVITTVHDGILDIHLKNNMSYHNINVKVYVSAPVLRRLSVSGSGNIMAKDTLMDDEQIKFSVGGSGDINAKVDAPLIIADIGGSGIIKLAGRTKDFKCSVGGSGDLKCRDLLSENTTVSVTGSGTAHVFASVNLNAKTTGSGDIYYSGNPASPVITKRGSGSVRTER